MNSEKIYRELAKEYNMTIAQIKAQLQEGIDEAYNGIVWDKNIANRLQLAVKIKAPTVDEFIEVTADTKNSNNILPKKGK